MSHLRERRCSFRSINHVLIKMVERFRSIPMYFHWQRISRFFFGREITKKTAVIRRKCLAISPQYRREGDRARANAPLPSLILINAGYFWSSYFIRFVLQRLSLAKTVTRGNVKHFLFLFFFTVINGRWTFIFPKTVRDDRDIELLPQTWFHTRASRDHEWALFLQINDCEFLFSSRVKAPARF